MRLPSWSAARTRRALEALILGAAVALTALSLGAFLGFAGPLITVGALLALAIAVWALTSLETGLWGAIGIITVLPFAALPFKVVFTPTFLDLALGGSFLVYVMQWMTGRRHRPRRRVFRVGGL